jgi:tetratricopeptide (TPR) repeat protein
LGYRPLEAEALVLMGRADAELTRMREAESVLDEALRAILASHHDDLLPEFAAWQIWVVGKQDRFTEAERWMRFADASIERTGASNSVIYAWVLTNMGAVYYLQNQFPQALEYLQRARTIKERVLGPDDPDVARTLDNISLALNKLGQPAQAIDLTDRSLRIYQRELGASHPVLADEFSNRGEIFIALGRMQDALKAYEKAGDIWQREFGPDSEQLAYALTGTGVVLSKMGRDREAISNLEKALVIRKRGNPDYRLLAETEYALASAMWNGHADPGRALSFAHSALEHYGKVPASEAQRAEVSAWVAKHRSALENDRTVSEKATR